MPFEEEHVTLAGLGEVGGRRAADHAGPHDDDPRPGRQTLPDLGADEVGCGDRGVEHPLVRSWARLHAHDLLQRSRLP